MASKQMHRRTVNQKFKSHSYNASGFTVSEVISQEELDAFAREHPECTDLTLSFPYEDDPPNGSELRFNVPFPNLMGLTLECVHVVFSFEKDHFPKLRSLDYSQLTINEFNLDLPTLKFLRLQHTEIRNGVEHFGPSLSRCWRLENIDCYKLWGLGSCPQEIYLPHCTEFALYRSDDLRDISLYAPQLQALNFQACYALDKLRFLSQPNEEYWTPACDPTLTAGQIEAYTDTSRFARFGVNVVNANCSPRVKEALKSNPRVRYIEWKPSDGDPFEATWCNLPRTAMLDREAWDYGDAYQGDPFEATWHNLPEDGILPDPDDHREDWDREEELEFGGGMGLGGGGMGSGFNMLEAMFSQMRRHGTEFDVHPGGQVSVHTFHDEESKTSTEKAKESSGAKPKKRRKKKKLRSCMYCKQKESKAAEFKKCGRCNTRYCSKECAAKDWKRHKKAECHPEID